MGVSGCMTPLCTWMLEDIGRVGTTGADKYDDALESIVIAR